MIRRRTFVAGMAAVMAGPRTSAAQTLRQVPKIGVLTVGPSPWPYLQTFEAALRDLGHVTGQSLVVELRSADHQPARLPALAADLFTTARSM